MMRQITFRDYAILGGCAYQDGSGENYQGKISKRYKWLDRSAVWNSS